MFQPQTAQTVHSFLDNLEANSHTAAQEERREALEAATNALQVQAFLARNSLSDAVHCSKTGQYLRRFSAEEIGQILTATEREEKRAVEILRRASQKQIAPHWLFTDEKALVNLAVIDPVGYFVYVANFLFPIIGIDHNDKEALEVALEARAQAKRKVWLAANSLPRSAILAANEYFRRFLSLTTALKASKFIAYREIEFEHIADSEASLTQLISACRHTLEKLIFHEIEKGRLEANFTFDEIIALQRRYQGHSNLRRQGRTREMTDLERYEMHLGNMFGEIDPEMEKRYYWNTRALRAKQEKAKDREARAAEKKPTVIKRKIAATVRIIPRERA